MIKGIDLRMLRNAEFIQFSKAVLNIIAANDPSGMQVIAQHQAFEKVISAISDLFVTAQGSAITAAVEAADKRRDTAISGISLLVNAMMYHYDHNMSWSAEMLNENLALYGAGIARQNYMAETASISNLIDDWTQKPQLNAAVNQLSLGGWLAELKTANTEFDNLYMNRTRELAVANPDTIREKRIEAMTAYYVLRDRLDAYHTISSGAGLWGKTHNEINALIDQYNVLLLGRTSSTDEAASPEPAPQQ
ncbi:MAG: DUF6261 family protein [Chitinophagaceae bacterium]